MTKKNGLLLLAAVALAAVYAVYFTDWFQPKTIKIFHANRNLNPRMLRGGGALPSLQFGVSRPCRLTELWVVPDAAFQTNRNVLPLWHLDSASNSVPVKMFSYGQNIPGMRPAIKGTRAQALETNVTYRLIVAAGKFRGEHKFELK